MSQLNSGAGTAFASASSVTVSNAISHGSLLNMTKDLLPEYDGSTSADVWISQLMCVRDVYSPPESVLRALIIGKLKDKAQSWLQSRPTYMIDEVSSIIEDLKSLFGHKESKLTLRRKFKSRKWKLVESFVEYFNDKTILANYLDIGEEELVDFIVEGIPDDQLKTQAYIQCYASKSQLLKAFSKVTLKANFRPRRQVVQQQQQQQ